MVTSFSKTPRYVLREGNHPTAISVHDSPSSTPITVIFGFADKPEYDAFISHCSLALTPYPLVRRFLIDQLASNGHSLNLIALDAATPRQPLLSATTFQSILASLQSNEDSVPITHQLCLDEKTAEYRIETLD